MIRQIKAIFPDKDPLSPKIIELQAEFNDTTGVFEKWIFPLHADFEDVLFFLEFTSDPKCRMEILGTEPNT